MRMRANVALAALALSLPVAHAGDFDSIDSITHAVYDVISGPAGARDWSRFRGLFADGGHDIAGRHAAGQARR